MVIRTRLLTLLLSAPSKSSRLSQVLEVDDKSFGVLNLKHFGSSWSNAKSDGLPLYSQAKNIPEKDEVTNSILVSPTEVPAMNFIRRVFMVLGIAGIAAAILRVKGKSEISTRRGGWRQVNPPISE